MRAESRSRLIRKRRRLVKSLEYLTSRFGTRDEIRAKLEATDLERDKINAVMDKAFGMVDEIIEEIEVIDRRLSELN